MIEAQAPVFTTTPPLIKDVSHLNRILKGVDSGQIHLQGGSGLFRVLTEEEGRRKHSREIVISAKPTTTKAPWHNGCIAVIHQDGQRVSRKALRQQLEALA